MSYRDLEETTWLDWSLMGSIAAVMLVVYGVWWVIKLPSWIWGRIK
jgi:hypothetical protein